MASDRLVPPRAPLQHGPMADGPRIAVIGNTGAGKTTLAALAARRLGLRHQELDALRHGPHWAETPDEEFRRLVAAEVARDAWVIDGNYNGVLGDLVWARATAIVWIDPPLPVVLWQVFWRSLVRLLLRRELWNGNRERLDWLSPGHPIRWAYSSHRSRRRTFAAAMDERWVRLRSRREAQRWLQRLSGTP